MATLYLLCTPIHALRLTSDIPPSQKPSLPPTYRLYQLCIWPQSCYEISNCNTQWLKTISISYCSQVCGFAQQFWSLLGSPVSCGEGRGSADHGWPPSHVWASACQRLICWDHWALLLVSLACTSLSTSPTGQPRHILRLTWACSHGSLREGREKV